jgi:hypothetical protein
VCLGLVELSCLEVAATERGAQLAVGVGRCCVGADPRAHREDVQRRLAAKCKISKTTKQKVIRAQCAQLQ